MSEQIQEAAQPPVVEPDPALARRHKALVKRHERLREAVEHVIAASPGTPDSVKRFLGEALRG